jgi:hypothetical protein
MNLKKTRVLTKKMWRFKSCKKAQNLRHRAQGKNWYQASAAIQQAKNY